MSEKDEDGMPLKDGDHITFSFGIPPVCVLARITTADDDLWIECLAPADVKPKREKLSYLIKYYQVWKANPKRVSAVLKDFSLGATLTTAKAFPQQGGAV